MFQGLRLRLSRLFGLDTLRGLLRLYTGLLVSLPLVLAAVFFFLFQRGQVLEAEMARLAESLRQERSVVRSWINERFDDLAFLARLDPVAQADRTAMADVFRQYLETHRYISEVIHVTPEGFMDAPNYIPPGVYVGDRAYFQEARAGRPSLETGLVGRFSGKPVCIFASPTARPDGAFGGLILLAVHLTSLDHWLREATSLAAGGVILCDGQGRILAPSSAVAAGGGAGTARAPQPLLDAGEKGVLYRDASGREMVGASVSLGENGWRLARQEPTATILAGYRRQSLWVALGALATVCLVTPLVLRLCRNLEKPLETLARYARELRTTGYGESCALTPPKRLPREIGELFEAFCDMARQVRAHIEEAERLSVQDALTGLYNRRFLFSGGAKLLDAATRAGQPCACLMLDVDHFKRVNDTFGHLAGDQVLAHLAGLLAGAVRKSDLVARYGGEEFAVLLTGAGLAHGVELAERIRRQLARTPCPGAGGPLVVTVSIGVSEARERVEFGESPLDDLLARADAAMYAAKAAGRDRVCS